MNVFADAEFKICGLAGDVSLVVEKQLPHITIDAFCVLTVLGDFSEAFTANPYQLLSLRISHADLWIDLLSVSFLGHIQHLEISYCEQVFFLP